MHIIIFLYLISKRNPCTIIPHIFRIGFKALNIIFDKTVRIIRRNYVLQRKFEEIRSDSRRFG